VSAELGSNPLHPQQELEAQLFSLRSTTTPVPVAPAAVLPDAQSELASLQTQLTAVKTQWQESIQLASAAAERAAKSEEQVTSLTTAWNSYKRSQVCLVFVTELYCSINVCIRTCRSTACWCSTRKLRSATRP
jgi:hypothetical protein